jgi:hypothetical protein
MPVAEEIYRSADLLVKARTGYESSLCVVTFDAFTDRRTLDRAGFGENFFDSRGVNAVHVLSRDNDWYLFPDIELALDAVAKATASFDRVSAYGSSMGAYAALRFGGLAGARTAIALSPQFSIDPRLVPFENRWDPDARRLDYGIERRLATKGFVPSADVFYDPGDRDARHVELYRDCLEVRDVRLPDCGHPVTVGRDDEAIAKFDEAMGIEPDNLIVLTRVCEFLESRRRLPAARAMAHWLSRLHPGLLRSKPSAPSSTVRG